MSAADPTGRPTAPIVDELDPALDDRQIERVWRRLDTPRPGPRLSTPLMWAAAGCIALLVALGWWRQWSPSAMAPAPATSQAGPTAIVPESAATPKPRERPGAAGPDETTHSAAAPGVAATGVAASAPVPSEPAPNERAAPRAITSPPTPGTAPSPRSPARPQPRRAPAPLAHPRGPGDEPPIRGLEAGAEREAAGIGAQAAGDRPRPLDARDEAIPRAALARDPLAAVAHIFDEYGPSKTASTVLLAMSQGFISSQPAYAARLLETGMARGFPANPAMHVLASDAWAAAGDAERAARAARRALRGAPEGPHAERMRRRSVPENPAR